MNSYEFPNTSSMFEATVLGPHQLGHYLSRKVRILGQFAQCKKSEGIARQLRITLPTLRNHLNHINKKLRTHNQFEAVVHAVHRKLI